MIRLTKVTLLLMYLFVLIFNACAKRPREANRQGQHELKFQASADIIGGSKWRTDDEYICTSTNR